MAETIAQLNVLCGATDNASGVLGIIKKNIVGLGVAAAGLGGAIMISKGAIDSYSSFETSVARVNTMLGEGQDAMDIYGDSLIDMSTKIPVSSVNELADGLYQTLSASIPASEAMNLVGVAAKTAEAGATDTFTAVDALTSIINAYGMEASSAEGISDKLFATYKRGKITVGELAGSIGNVSAVGAQLGVSLDDILAGFSTMTRAGIGAEEVATGLTASFNAFLKPTEEMSEMMQKYGYETGVAMLQGEGFAGSLGIIQDEVSSGNYQLADLTANVRAMRLTFPLTGTLAQEFAQDIQDIGSASGDMGQAYEKMASTTESKTQLLKNQVNELKMGIGEALVPALQKVVDVLTPLVNLLSENSTVIAGLIALVGGLAAAYITYKVATMAMTIAQGAATAAQWLLNASLFACPLTWIIAAIAAVIAIVVLLVTHWEEVKEALGKVWDWLKEKFGAVKDAIVGFVGNLIDKWKEFGGKVKEKCGEIKESITSWASDTGEKIKSWASDTGDKIKSWAGDTKEKITTWASDAGGKIKDFVATAVTKFIEFHSKGVQKFRDFASTAKNKIIGLKNDIFAVFSNAASWLINAGKNIIQGLIDGIKSMGGKVIGAIKDAVGGAWDTVKGFFGFGSPSKLMMKAGEDVIKGFNIGLSNVKVNQLVPNMESIEAPGISHTVNTSSSGSGSPTYHITQNLTFTNVADEQYIHKIGGMVEKSLRRVVA